MIARRFLVVAATCCVVQLAGSWFAARPLSAQVFAHPFQPSPAVITELDAAGERLLLRAKTLVAEKPPTDAVEAMLQVIDRHGSALVEVHLPPAAEKDAASQFENWWPADRYAASIVRTWEKSHPDALAMYRQFVDRSLVAAIEAARATHEIQPLRTALRRFSAATQGADGWQLLGELYLEQGQYSAARLAFVRSLELAKNSQQQGNALAKVALTAILCGDDTLADSDMRQLLEVAADAEGEMNGQRGRWITLLQSFRQQHKANRNADGVTDVRTFADDFERAGGAAQWPKTFDLAATLKWSLDLPRIDGTGDILAAARQRIAEPNAAILAYHPLVVDRTVFVRQDAGGLSSLLAIDWETGVEQWRFEQEFPLPEERGGRSPELLSDAERLLPPHVGSTRYTLTAEDGTIFARMGSPLTAPSARHLDGLRARDQGWLVGLDLATQGRPKEGFPLYPSAKDLAFEGTPIADEGHIYVLQSKREGVRRQLYVACFDRLTTPVDTGQGRSDGLQRGRLLWRTFIATADFVGGGDYGEISHGLLSRLDDRLLVNTNLGAVAAVEATTGRIEWLVRYPRAAFTAEPGNRSDAHFLRDLAKPVVTSQCVVFAPRDCNLIFGCEPGTGKVVWTLGPEVAGEVMHLLGVANGRLIVTGSRVWWVDLATGKVAASYANSSGQDKPQGRGLITADVVLWPTQNALHLLPTAAQGNAPAIRVIDLKARGATGGNVVVTPGGLLIASGTKLQAFEVVSEQSAGK